MRYYFASKVIFFIAGIVWCVAIFRRLGEDIEEVRNPTEPEARYVVIGFWVVTAIVAVLVLMGGINLTQRFLALFSGW